MDKGTYPKKLKKKRKQNKLMETMECVGNRGPNEIEEQMWLGEGVVREKPKV